LTYFPLLFTFLSSFFSSSFSDSQINPLSLGLDLSSLMKNKGPESTYAKNQRDRCLIELDLPGLIIEMPGEEMLMEPSCRSQRSHRDRHEREPREPGVELQFFDFKPFYQRDFNGKGMRS
jgi:hypothetical protein